MIHNYTYFKDSLNENVQQAKVYLKNLALKKKKEDVGETDQPVGLSADEVRTAETNPNFLKIKQMCEGGLGIGYTYLFTKIFFDEMGEDAGRFTELKEFHDEIKSLGNIIKDLPIQLAMYAAVKPTDADGRGPYERLTDDLEQLKLQRKAKKFVEKLLPNQKQWVEKASKQQKRSLVEVATGFLEMGLDDDDKFDPELNKTLQRGFFSKIADYKSLQEIIDGAKATIKAASNGFLGKFLKKIAKVNAQLGEINGADIVYNKDGYLVIEVFTFVANRELNAHTSHCIVRSIGHWDTYLKDFNKQYYVYNFNIDPSSIDSVIGMTIDPSGRVTDAHKKDDERCTSTFKSIVDEWNIPFGVFAPMSKEEMEAKRKRIEASKKIIDPNLTFGVAEKALGDGADPNAKGGTPLKNAVKANNKLLVQLLLHKGAMPNITEQNSSDTAISYAEDLEMIKILVDAGASLNSSVFKKVSNDPESVRYLLDSGMDPSFERSLAFRQAAKSGNIEAMDLLLKYADNIPDDKMSIAEKQLMMITERRNMALKFAAEHGKSEATVFILQKLFELGYKDLVGKPELVKSLVDYIQNTDASKPEDKQKVIDAIRDWSKDKFTEAKESKRFNNFKTFRY
jgi:hypothetical protein